MANIRAIIPTRTSRTVLMVVGLALVLFAVINLFATMTPLAAHNARIDAALKNAMNAPVGRLALYIGLRGEQEKTLAAKPSEPYGWSRLAYLRLVTEGNLQEAFAALRLSDLVSPFEASQLPERARMWRELRVAENADQQAYQDNLWQKAYGMEREATWSLAVQYGLIEEVGSALLKTDPKLYEEWKTRIAEMPTMSKKP